MQHRRFTSCRFFPFYCLALTCLFSMSGLKSAHAQAQVSNGEYIMTQPFFEDQVTPGSRQIVRANPGIGGGVIGTVDRNDQVIIGDYQGNQSFAGVDLQSQEGLLGAAQINDGNPFEIVIEQSPTRVSVGSLGVENQVRLGLQAGLGVTYTGANPAQDINAVWGRGEDEVSFPVTRFGEVGYTPFNLDADGNPLVYGGAVMTAAIEAGSATGTPPDSPSDSIDPNDGTAVFPGVGSLEMVHPTLGTFICSASVIDGDKLLTAAHCFDQDSDGVIDAGIVAGSTFNLNDGGSPSTTRGIASAVLDPDFAGFSIDGGHDDLAVVTLDSVLPAGTTKYPIRNTSMTSAEVIEMVGYGISGFGDVGGIEVLPDFHVKRSGKNNADLFVLDDEGAGTEEVFMFDFDGPTGTGFLGGASLGNDVEASVRGGDSGGPAFVDEGGVLAIGGVIAFEFALDGITPPTGEFGVMGGGQMITDEKWLWIKSNAPGAQLVPEPTGFAICLPLALVGLLLRKRR